MMMQRNENTEQDGVDVRSYINLTRLFMRGGLAELALSHAFASQEREPKSSVMPLVFPLRVIAKRVLVKVVNLIPVAVREDCNSPKLDQGIWESRALKRSLEWWIERRFGEPIISVKLKASPAELAALYGQAIVEVADKTKNVELIVESYLSDKWSRIRQPLFEPLPVEAPPRVVLITQYQREDQLEYVITPTVPIVWPDPDFHVIDEDTDMHSPLGSVYWRKELRDSERISRSRFQLTRKKALESFGHGIAPLLGADDLVDMTIESYPSDSWKTIRTPVGPSTSVTLSEIDKSSALEIFRKRHF